MLTAPGQRQLGALQIISEEVAAGDFSGTALLVEAVPWNPKA